MELLPAPALLRVRERPVAHRATGTARVFGAVSPIEPLDQGDDTSRCASSLTRSDAQPRAFRWQQLAKLGSLVAQTEAQGRYAGFDE